MNWRFPVFVALSAICLSAQSLPISYERLLGADKEPGNWLMYNHTYNGWRFSSLDQITAQNVSNLHVKWLFQGRHQDKLKPRPWSWTASCT
jgi:glucose dehydrogenase